MADSTSARPIDDFDWLPAHLQRLGTNLDEIRPHRVQIDVPGEAGSSAIRWGDGPSRIVYLHGGGQNAHTWDMVAALVGEPAIAIDLPGHGHSAWRDDKDYHPTRNAEAIARALDATGTRPQLVVGMSLGGLTSIALAAARPDLVPKLVLVDILPGVENVAAVRGAAGIGAVALVSGPREFESFEAMEQATLAATGGDRPAEMLRRGVWHNAVQNADGTWRWRYDDLRGNGPTDTSALWDALAGSTAPLTLVKGGASPFVSEEALARLHEVRPDAEVVVVPDAGHAVQSQNAPALTEVIQHLHAAGDA